MDNISIELKGEKELDAALNRLTGEELNKLMKKATLEASKIVVKQAKINLRGVTGRAKSNYTNLKRKWNLVIKKGKVVGVKTLEQGIGRKYHAVSKNSDDAGFTKVNIMGDFRLRFFEGGTKERRKKSNGAKTGHMTATNFFTKAISQSSGEALDKMVTVIEQNLIKIWEKQ